MCELTHDDPALPTLHAALYPATAAAAFAASSALHPVLRRRLADVRLRRYKPGRRAVIEYTLAQPGQAQAEVLIGKLRRLRSGRTSYELMQTFRAHGFDDDSADGIAVPAPIAHIGPLRLWLQRKVRGSEATHQLGSAGGVELARRIAEAAFKIHCAGIAPRRCHGMADELSILHARLDDVAAARPAWRARLERLKISASRIGLALAPAAPVGIHRDFYADQIIVDGERLWMLDFDLYCRGDPGLDLGNFIGHVTEQSLRRHGAAEALAGVEEALTERYCELAGEKRRASIGVHALLTLMRHVYLSTQHAERRASTAALLALCETRAAAELKKLGLCKRG